MSDLKREWNPCKVCKKYYDYNCNRDIKNCKKFIPENSFRNFLAMNNYDIKNLGMSELDKIYLVDDNVDIVNVVNYDKEILDLRNNDIGKILDILIYGLDFCHVFILSIDSNIRDSLYNNDYVMSHYDIKMVLSSNVKKSLKYRLDERFNFIEYKDL